jgi:hypothetical protein
MVESAQFFCRFDGKVVRSLMLLLACAVLPSPAVAQIDDAAYCAQLGNLALRYTGSAGGNGGLRPDFTTLAAIDDCNKGNTAAGIPVLEKKLRSNGFTLPRR